MLDRIHKISEIVAAFAIVGSLIFVGIQMQHNTDAVRINTSQASVAMWQATSQTMIANDALMEEWKAELYNQFPEHSLRLRWFLNYMLKTAEHNYHNWLDGNLSDRDWYGIRGRLELHLLVQSHYVDLIEVENLNRFFTPEFRALLVDMFKETEAQRNVQGIPDPQG